MEDALGVREQEGVRGRAGSVEVVQETRWVGFVSFDDSTGGFGHGMTISIVEVWIAVTDGGERLDSELLSSNPTVESTQTSDPLCHA